MKRSRILLITALVALLAGGWYVAKRGGETTLIGRLLDVANKGGIKSLDGAKLQGNATQSGNPLEEVAGLAIKGINLFQGNKGLELWRLKASWAHMSQNGDTIDVDKPVVRYALGEGSASNPDDDVLDVQAQLGKITDNQRFLTLWDDVVITRYDDVITSSRMNYDANKRLMTFPEGAALESPTASGRPPFLHGILLPTKCMVREACWSYSSPAPTPQTPMQHLLRANRKPIHSKNSLNLQGNKPVIDPTVYS